MERECDNRSQKRHQISSEREEIFLPGSSLMTLIAASSPVVTLRA